MKSHHRAGVYRLILYNHRHPVTNGCRQQNTGGLPTGAQQKHKGPLKRMFQKRQTQKRRTHKGQTQKKTNINTAARAAQVVWPQVHNRSTRVPSKGCFQKHNKKHTHKHRWCGHRYTTQRSLSRVSQRKQITYYKKWLVCKLHVVWTQAQNSKRVFTISDQLVLILIDRLACLSNQ